MIKINSNDQKEGIDQNMLFEILTQGLTELSIRKHSLTIGFLAEAERIILKDMSKNQIRDNWRQDRYTVKETEPDNFVPTSYVTPAYQWLLQHLWNPYPSNTFKASLAKDFDVPLKSVTIWFANVRRRIGWTAISKRFFNGSRADTVDFAHRVFKREPSELALDEVVSKEFFLMKTKAGNLYRNELDEQVAMNGILFDDVEGSYLLEGSNLNQDKGTISLESILSNGLTNGFERSAHTYKRYTGKRCRQTSILSDTLGGSHPYELDLVEQSRKRFRTPSSSSSQSNSSRSSTPMPSTPKDDSPSEFPFEVWQKGIELEELGIEKFNEEISPSQVKAPSSRPKKRRMSQSDELPSPSKRPRGLMALSRLHAVSDPYVSNRNLFNVESCESHINLTFPEPATLNDLLPENSEIELFKNWSDLYPPSSLLSTKTVDLTTAQDANSDAPALLSATSSSSGDDKQVSTQPGTSPVDLSSFADLDKFLEALAADPSLLPPLLPDGLEELPLFDSNFVKTLSGSELPSLTTLDIPLSTSSVEADFETVANLSCLDIPLISGSVLSSSTSLAEAVSLKSIDSISSAVKDTVESTTTQSSDEPSLSLDLLDLQCPISPIETKLGLEVSPVIESSPNNEDKDAAAAKEREDKLKRIQMLEAEMEKLKQEIAC